MSARIIKLVQGVHMGLGHTGLSYFLKKNAKLEVESMDEENLVMCINKAGDKLKVIGGKGTVIGYLRSPKGHKLMVDALQYLPKTFGANGFDYDAACKKALEKRLGTVF